MRTSHFSGIVNCWTPRISVSCNVHEFPDWLTQIYSLVGGLEDFLFSAIAGMMIQSDELIFFRGVGQPPIRSCSYPKKLPPCWIHPAWCVLTSAVGSTRLWPHGISIAPFLVSGIFRPCALWPGSPRRVVAVIVRLEIPLGKIGMLADLPSGYLTVCHGIDGPFIDGLPIKNGDFPWLC